MFRNENLSYVDGMWRGRKALMLHFEVMRSGILRATKEYNLVYNPTTNEWFGDIIAYQQWCDLESEEVMRLREECGLDELVSQAIKGLALY